MLRAQRANDFIYLFIHFYSATTHEIIQIKNNNFLCSLDPPKFQMNTIFFGNKVNSKFLTI